MPRHPLASAALLLLVSLSLAGCTRNEATSLADAKARIEKRDAAGAEIELKNLLQKFPKSGEARYLLADQMAQRGDMAGALIEVERARELRFDENKVLPLLARALVVTGKTRRVVEELADRKLSNAQAMAELQSTVASAFAREGELKRAGQAIDLALQAAPDAEVALLAKAKLTAVQGDAAGALAATEALLAKHPKSDEGWALKADLLLRSPGGQPAAMAAYRQALEALPEQVHARAALVALQLSRGELDAAAKDLEALRKAAPRHFSTSFLDAQMAVARRDYPRARTIYQAMLKTAPDHPLLLISAAENELRLNALGQAESLASKAMSLVPGDLSARRVLSQVLLRKGQPAKAIVVLSPLVDRTDTPADVLALSAQANLMNGNNRIAEDLYKRLAKLKPADARLRTIIATSGFNHSSPEAVVSELQAIAADDKGISADLALVSARIQAKQWDAALKAIAAIEAKQPDKALAPQLKAQVLARNNDLPGARQALEDALRKEPGYMPAITALAALDLSEKKPDLAKKRFQDLLESQPKNAPALLALADLAQRTQAPRAEVMGYLQRAIQADPQDTSAHLAMIDLQTSRGDLRGALTTANAAVAALPDNIDMLERLAKVQLRLGEVDQALASFGKITTLNPKAAAGFMGQAQAQLATGNLSQAQRSIDRVLEREPQNLEAQAVQVAIHLAQKNPKAALVVARTVQANRKTEAIGWQLEADIESSQGHWDLAAAALRQALTKTGAGVTPIKLHYALVKAGKVAEAETFTDGWLKNHPRDTQVLFYLGDSAQAAGRSDLAERRYRELLAVSPDHALALNNLAMLLLNQKKPGAMELIDRAVAVLPDNPALLDTQAEALLAAGEQDKALEVQGQAAALAPRSAALRLKLARMQLAAGNKQAAKSELNSMADASLQMDEGQRAELKRMLASLAR